MRMRKVKWATDYLPTANCLVKEPSKQAGNWKKLMGTDTLHIEIGCGKGNYSLGIKEQLIFPEIEYDKIDKIRGMDIIFVTTAKTDEEARELLTLLGMPFRV